MGKGKLGGKLRKSGKGSFLFFLLLFLACAAVRSWLSVFPKRAVFLDDEILFLELAQNIGRNGALEVFHLPVNYSKILYPLLLAPFYGIQDAAARQDAMSVFNAVLISSSLIPGYLLAKRFLSAPWKVNTALLLLAVSPAMGFSSTFMAENLYVPLLLWGFLLAAAGPETAGPEQDASRLLRNSVFTGLVCFLLYLTKETGAALFLAVLVLKAGELRAARTDQRRIRRLSLLCFAAAGIVPTLLVRGVLYGFRGYPYLAQLVPEYFNSAAYVVFMLLSAVCLLTLFLLSGLFYPVLLPLSRRGNLPEAQRKLLGVSGVYLSAAVMGTAWGISASRMTYDLGTMETSLRYLAGALYPFLTVFLSEADREETESRTVRRTACITAVLCAVFLFLPRISSAAELPGLQGLASVLNGTSGADLWVKAAALAVLLIPVFLNRAGRRRYYLLLLPLMTAFAVFNSVFFSAGLREAQEVKNDPELLAQTSLLDRTLDGAEGNTLVICPDRTDERMNTIHAWLNDNYYVIDSYDFQRLHRESWPSYMLDTMSAEFPSPVENFAVSETYIPGYINQVVCFDGSIEFPYEGAEQMTPEGLTIARVLGIRDPSVIFLTNPLDYEPGDTIPFVGKNEKSVYFMVSGFSTPEDWFTWICEEEAVVRIRPAAPEHPALIADWDIAVTNGKQTCRIYAGDIQVFKGTVEAGRVSFEIPSEGRGEDGYLTLRFVFPKAREPGNGDARKLGVAFQSLKISVSGSQ